MYQCFNEAPPSLGVWGLEDLPLSETAFLTILMDLLLNKCEMINMYMYIVGSCSS